MFVLMLEDGSLDRGKFWDELVAEESGLFVVVFILLVGSIGDLLPPGDEIVV